MRNVYSANHDWKFIRGAAPVQRRDRRVIRVWDTDYDDSNWEDAVLPHTVREEALMCSTGRNYQGECWYRRTFRINEEDADRTLWFELEAAMQRVDAWLDGEPFGCRTGGYLPMLFDVTGIGAGLHLLVLRVDNRDMPDVPPGKPQGALDFCYFGGLYRDAWLYSLEKVHFTSAVHAGKTRSGGLYIRYQNVSKESADILVDAHYENCSDTEKKVYCRILLNGTVQAVSAPMQIAPSTDHTEKMRFTVPEPKLWSPYHPALYTLQAELYISNELVDTVTERIGIRKAEFRADGFYLNGEKLFLNGANRHQEYPFVGYAMPDSVQHRDVRLLRDAGIISVRTAHYPQDKAFMDACDEMGVLCVIPTPGWQIHPESALFDERSYENTRRLIRMNRNHPSSLLYEPILNETDYPEYFAKKQLEIVREELDEDDAWCACDSHYSYAEHYPVIYSHRPIEGRSRYIREYGDAWIEQFGPMKTMRRVRRGGHVSYYTGGEQSMIRSAQEHFEAYAALRKDPTLTGAAIWAGIDHNRGYDASEGAVGMLDLVRLPKFEYDMYVCQQSMEEAGAQCRIVNYHTAGSPKDVVVYTNAPLVRLFLNGRVIGECAPRDSWKSMRKYGESFQNEDLPDMVYPPACFRNVPWEAGVLRAEALVNGAVCASDEVRTPEKAVKLQLVPQWAGENRWIADGADLLLVHACIVDANGTCVPDAEPMVRFSVQGDAEIVGSGYRWTNANPAQAEAGIAAVLLRAGITAGKIILMAEADGLAPTKCELELTEDKKVYLANGHFVSNPGYRPEYEIDKQERFSEIQSLKLEDFFQWDMGRNMPAKASSCKDGYDPASINRGYVGSPWIASDGSAPQWWQCDMQEERCVTGVTIRWYYDGLWYTYSAEVSNDGENWQNCGEASASGQSILPMRFAEAVRARYFRIVIHSVTGGAPAGMYLVEIHGQPDKDKL